MVSKPEAITLPRALIEEAQKWVGVQEVGKNRGVEVEMFQKAVDGKASGEPWCAAFVEFCIKQVVAQHGVTTPVVASEHCLTIWNTTPVSQRLTTPVPGCLVIWRHGDSTQGHIGVVTEVTADPRFIQTIEGNTGPEVKAVNSEGDGVYVKLRNVEGTGNMKVLGFLRVFPDEAIEQKLV